MKTSNVVGEALVLQKIISEELIKNISMPDKLQAVLAVFARHTNADEIILYATINENYLEYMADYHGDNYKTNIRFGESVEGNCAALKQVQTQISEQENKSVICIPILRLNNTIGVVCLAKKGIDGYSQSECEIIETLSLVLQELFANKSFTEYRNFVIHEKGIKVRDVLYGQGLNKGYGVGRAVLHHRRKELVNIFTDNTELEQSKLQEGRNRLIDYFDSKIKQTENYLGNTTEIMEAYKMFAQDKGWYKKISADIDKGYTAEAAVEHVYEDMWKKLSATSDSYLKERLYDLRDISDRLRNFIAGGADNLQVSPDEDVIIIAQFMGPSDLMDYNYEHIRGLIIEDCTPTMHVVIVAKALNIPVIAKIHGILKEVKSGEVVAMNGSEGIVHTNPSENIIEQYRKKIISLPKVFAKLRELKSLPNKTLDGIKINMAMNYGLDFDYNYIEPTGCNGIGLYRTEIMFMTADKMPDVAMQEAQYKKLFNAVNDKKIIFRSLDVGSDKFLPYWGEIKEENPAIGWRAIRITLDRRAILRQQMRAMLRAAAGKELNVMFPMISTLQEFLDAKETLMMEFEKEKQRNNPTAKKINVGIMIEVPSVLFQLDDILQQVDFVSIGTNDLYQFIYACDRTNPRLIGRYDVLSAPFLRLMKQIVDKSHQYDVYCSVCGEMASNPLEAMCLIGLGYRNLSVSGASYAAVKKMLISMNCEDVTDYMKMLLKSTQTSLRAQLTAYAYDHAIAID